MTARAVQEDEVGGGWYSAIALVVAALVIGLSSLRARSPGPPPPQQPGFDLTSNPSSFTISSAIYAVTGVQWRPSGSLPGHDPLRGLQRPQPAQRARSRSRASPAPSIRAFRLRPPTVRPRPISRSPAFSGSATVGAGATTALPGVTIKLLDSGDTQDACENLHLPLHLHRQRPVHRFDEHHADVDAQPVHPGPVGHLHGQRDCGEPEHRCQPTEWHGQLLQVHLRNGVHADSVNQPARDRDHLAAEWPASPRRRWRSGPPYVEAVYPALGHRLHRQHLQRGDRRR